MTAGRSARYPTARTAAPLVAALGLAGLLATSGCGPAAASARAPRTTEARSGSASALPSSADRLGELVVASVPSGLPRMPDAQVQPPAGEKDLDDVAGYSTDPARERRVLAGYGFRFGWERFWGAGATAQTSVFVDQFAGSAGAGEYAADLARNDAAHYDADLHSRPPGLPTGCRLLTADAARPSVGLDGPTAIAWCAHGRFTVAVTSVARSDDAALDEVSAVVAAQLARLPAS